MIRRTKTLVVFNTWKSPESWVPDKTSDGYTSEQCADAYAAKRDYCGDGIYGHYWKLGFDWGGIGMAPGYATGTIAQLNTLICTKSFSPGKDPQVDNHRYVGQPIQKAIANAVADGQLDAIFTESLVPNALRQCGQEAPDGWFIALCPMLDRVRNSSGGSRYEITDLFLDYKQTVDSDLTLNNWIVKNRDTQLPYGRIGFPGCTYADILRIADDANFGERQNNLHKRHMVGGTSYIAGGDSAHMNRANAYIAKSVRPENLGCFNQDGSYSSGLLPGSGSVVDWEQFANGLLTPPMELFGLLFSLNQPYTPDWHTILNSFSYNPVRGCWAYDWCSGSSGVGYDALKRGATATILCEIEPYSNGLPAVDCVAWALMKGLTMAEANFLSDHMAVANHSVYGAPDYAPYALTNSIQGPTMSTVIVTIASKDLNVPATTVPAGWVVRLNSTALTLSQTLLELPPNNQVEFADVPPGTYIPSAERQDNTGAVIGAAVSGPSFVVPVPPPETIHVSIPDTVFASLA